ncbi:MAG: HNH endonuclease [Mycobacteriaceae bacterium]|nr:HNH endonuclease [Mycobacteriaceae bacterium]
MYSTGQELAEAFDDLDRDIKLIQALAGEAHPTPELFSFLERWEKAQRAWPTVQHALINSLVQQATPAEIGGRLNHVLANRLHITRAEAGRRAVDAEMLGPRTTFTGEPLEPLWSAAAAAQAAGEIGVGHIQEIRRFFKQLPDWVDLPTKEQAERDLVKVAREHRPDELRRAADFLADCLNPDGNYSDDDRAWQRGVVIGKQGEDGMSRISGYLTPELRAGLDAVLSKWAAPGMCNPNDEKPTVDGTPSEDAIARDHRSPPQRNHDALNAMCRSVLASGKLGSHHGLPVSVIVKTTLEELELAAGKAETAGGTWVSMRDLIRMASHARHYLAIFDKHTERPLYLGASKRIASPDQRIVLQLTDRGCTRPGCTMPGYWCEVHHTEPWADGGHTDVDKLTLACGGDHKLADQGWTTRKRKDGTTEWIPPPHLDHGQSRVNNYHHPQRYFATDEEDGKDEEDEDEAGGQGEDGEAGGD